MLAMSRFTDQEVSFASCNLLDEDFEEISECLAINTTTKTLNLSSNDLSVNAAQDLRNGLCKNTTLTTLWLNNMAIADVQFSIILSAIKENKTLELISLSTNFISDIGVTELCSVLDTDLTPQHALRNIILINNAIEDSGIREAIATMKRHDRVSITLLPRELDSPLYTEAIETNEYCKAYADIYFSGTLPSGIRMENSHVTPATFPALTKLITMHSDQLTSLVLFQCNLSDEHLTLLLAVLAKSVTTLEHLDLCNNSFSEDKYKQLAEEFLSKCDKLTSLCVGNFLPDFSDDEDDEDEDGDDEDGDKYDTELVVQGGNSFSFNYKRIKKNVMPRVSPCINVVCGKAKLQHISLINCSLSKDDIVAIGTLTGRNGTLTSLEIKLCKFSDTDALETLVKMPKNSVKYLTIEEVKMSDTLCKHLIKELGNSDSVEMLNLAYNQITKSSAPVLAEYLGTTGTLKEINLNNNFLEGGVLELCEPIQLSMTLTDINLSSNDIPDDAMKKLATALYQNFKILNLNVDFNQGLSQHLMNKINEYLKRNRKLEAQNNGEEINESQAQAEDLKSQAHNYMSNRDYDAAIEKLQLALQIDMNDAEAWTQKAKCHYMQNEHEKGIECCNYATDADNSYSRAHYYKAKIHLDEKDYRDAKEAIDMAIFYDSNIEKYKELRSKIVRKITGNNNSSGTSSSSGLVIPDYYKARVGLSSENNSSSSSSYTSSGNGYTTGTTGGRTLGYGSSSSYSMGPKGNVLLAFAKDNNEPALWQEFSLPITASKIDEWCDLKDYWFNDILGFDAAKDFELKGYKVDERKIRADQLEDGKAYLIRGYDSYSSSGSSSSSNYGYGSGFITYYY